MEAPRLSRRLDQLEYDPAELAHHLDQDARWRERSEVIGGPLRTFDGQMAPVPAFMRLDLQTDRNGPVPEHRPDLGACWLWTGVPVHGYGYIRIGKRKVQAYRVNYERWIGPIPHGAVIDHLCRVRACVRPDHLEPTTYSQNTVRSPIHGSQVKAARGECPAGHPFDERNTYRRPGTNVRQCRACLAENKRRRTGAQPRPRATETHCARGHVWTPPRGKRCPTCNREAGAAFRARDRAARAAG